MTGLNGAECGGPKRTTRAGLSLCAAAAATTLLITISGFAIHKVDCLPVKLVADFPTFAATLLGSLAHDPAAQPALVTSSSSSSYLSNDQSDDDLDDPTHLATKANTPSVRHTHSSPSLVDYEVDLQATSTGNSSASPSTNSSTASDDDSTFAIATMTAPGGDLANSNSSSEASGSSGSSGGNSSITLTLLGGGKKSHIIRLPNGQSFQFCDELIDLSCRDENAVCKMGACVCKPGFFLHRQSGLCQSISDLLKNCDNDYQCQAFDVDLVCDTKSHERSSCDCAEGLYFDPETYSCIPCHRNTFVLATNNRELLKKLNQSQSTESSTTASNNSSSSSTTGDTSNETGSNTTIVSPQSKVAGTTLRPCKPIDLAKLNHRRRKQQHQVPYSSLYDQPSRGSSSSSSAGSSSTSSSSFHPASSSDPFRIKTPLEVFMGAIMLFTLLTVCWFFLQRMIHDCRVIFRSLRSNDFAGTFSDGMLGGTSSHLTGIAPNSRPGSQLYLDPAGQAVARLLSNDGYNSSLAGIYQRDLAGVMVQHLAANLSPSSTSHALSASNGPFSRGDNEISIYPLTISSQQSRSAAAAAAAQLLLSPNHPAIAILRAAAASANQNPHSDYHQTSLLNSMLDPPPKYEEAIAQSESNQPSVYVPQHHTNPISTRASDSNNENMEADQEDENNEEFDTTRDPISAATHVNQPTERSVNSLIGTDASENLGVNDNQPPPYQSSNLTDMSRSGSSSTSLGGSSDAEQTNTRRQNSTKRKTSRRSRRGRGSTSRNHHQDQHPTANPDSDDTLTESH